MLPIASTEWILTNAYKADLIAWLTAHPEAYEEVIRLSLTDKQPYAWRAAWLLWSCMEANDRRIQPYMAKMIKTLVSTNDEHGRELLIILLKMDIPEESEGVLYNHCVHVWEQTGNKPSVRLNAFKMLIKIAGKHPELQTEISLLAQSQYTDSLSAAANKSISLLLKGIRNRHA